jgi:hypothetical protein
MVSQRAANTRWLAALPVVPMAMATTITGISITIIGLTIGIGITKIASHPQPAAPQRGRQLCTAVKMRGRSCATGPAVGRNLVAQSRGVSGDGAVWATSATEIVRGTIKAVRIR